MFSEMDIFSKIRTSVFVENSVCKDAIFIWLPLAMEQLLENFYFGFPHATSFSALEVKQLANVGKYYDVLT